MASVSIHSDNVTLPHEVSKVLSIKDGDELDVSVRQGMIILKPKHRKGEVEKRVVSLLDMIGKGKGAFSSHEEADLFIRNERDQWD